MSMEAVALVRIEASTLASTLKAAGPTGTALEGANGDTMSIRALDNATLIFTSTSVRDAEPADLGVRIRLLIGDVLDQHTDERGVFMFPKVALPKAKTYDEAIDEVGEMGEWTPLVATAELEGDEAEEGDGDLAGLADGLLGQLGPDVMDLQRRMMEGDPTAMQDAISQVGAMLADPSKQAALMKAVSAFSGENSPLKDMAANLPPGMTMPNPADLMKNMDVGALQEQAQKMMAENPTLEAKLLEKMKKQREDGDKSE